MVYIRGIQALNFACIKNTDGQMAHKGDNGQVHDKLFVGLLLSGTRS